MPLNPTVDLARLRAVMQSLDYVVGRAVLELVDAGKPVSVESIATRLGQLPLEDYAQMFALRVRGLGDDAEV